MTAVELIGKRKNQFVNSSRAGMKKNTTIIIIIRTCTKRLADSSVFKIFAFDNID